MHQFIQPFSAVPVMQREGQFKYALAAGKYRAANSKDKEPEFLQGTLSYGLPWDSTIYGGTLASADYWAGALGIGKGFGEFGSLSLTPLSPVRNCPVRQKKACRYARNTPKTLLRQAPHSV